MAKRKSHPAPAPSESTVSLLEPARGVMDTKAPQLAQVVAQFLTLPLEEQLAAAHWMGEQPEYAAVLGYLLEEVGVSGALRRAVKQALFELRRSGVPVRAFGQGTTAAQEALDLSRQWVVQEVFAASPYDGDVRYPLHLRCFMQHASGQKAVFLLFLNEGGYLWDALMVEEGVNGLYQECLDNQLRYPWIQGGIHNPLRHFVRLPVDWAISVIHECRQRNLRDLKPMPTHAAYFWGRLPDPPREPVAPLWESISEAETSWAVTSLVTPNTAPEPSTEALYLLTMYLPRPERVLRVLEKTAKEMQSPLLLPAQSEQQRREQMAEKVQQGLFPDDSLREPLLFLLPVFGSIHLLGEDRVGAAWLKALWRELKERADRPFWRTQVATVLTAMAISLFTTAARTDEAKENHPSS